MDLTGKVLSGKRSGTQNKDMKFVFHGRKILVNITNTNRFGFLRQKGDKSMNRKEYYVIQNSNGKFFKADNLSGGYPCFVDDFEFCDKYNSRQFAEDFLKGDYVTRMFPKEFVGSIVRTVKLILE